MLSFVRMLVGASAIAALAIPAGAARAGALTQVASLSAASFLTFSDATGAIYTAPVSYALGSNTLTFGGFANSLERVTDGSNYADSNFPAGTQLIAQCGNNPSCSTPSIMTITFATPVTGFTVSADEESASPTTFAAAAYDGTTSLGLIFASSTSFSGGSPAVLAATSSLPITSLQITDFATANAAGDFVVGNIGVPGSVVAIPEPNSVALAGVGLIGLTAAIRRRRV